MALERRRWRHAQRAWNKRTRLAKWSTALTTTEPPPKHRTADRMRQALTATITSSAYSIASARDGVPGVAARGAPREIRRYIYLRAGGVPTRHTHKWDAYTRGTYSRVHTQTLIPSINGWGLSVDPPPGPRCGVCMIIHAAPALGRPWVVEAARFSVRVVYTGH